MALWPNQQNALVAKKSVGKDRCFLSSRNVNVKLQALYLYLATVWGYWAMLNPEAMKAA